VTSTRRFTPISDWTDPRHLRGLAGEHAALAYLTACGWSVEAHRFRFGGHDLDLVIRRGPLVAFVEVKTRQSAESGPALESIGKRKRRSLELAAQCWRLRHGHKGDQYRFDVVTVTGRGAQVRVEHLPDAWRLSR
jgi:putative endonuclease